MKFLFSTIPLLPLTVSLTVLFSACTHTDRQKNMARSSDSLNLNVNESIYDSMRTHFNADTAFMAALAENILAGDSNAIQAANFSRSHTIEEKKRG
jgi:hypothetical protein